MAAKKTTKLFLDSRQVDQPDGTSPFRKNGIEDYLKGAQFNEPGFALMSAVVPYYINGVIETDTMPVIFSTNDVNSAIGFFDPNKGTYIPILNDATLPFKIGFKRANFITGEFQKNNKDEIIVVFTDKVLDLMLLNCTTPVVTKPEDLLFFLRATAPTLTVTTESGGQLATGAYSLYVKYARIDGSETPWLTSTAPVIVSGADGTGLSDKSIRLVLDGCDTTYDYVVIGVLKKVAGVSSAEELSFIPLSDTTEVVYTGNEVTTTLTTEELLIPPAVYRKVGAITQLNDQLFMGNLTQSDAINIQKYANLATLRFVSQEVDITALPDAVLNGTQKGFPHGEVVAAYLRLRMKDGSKSRAFHIPGIAPTSGDRASVTIGGMTGLAFQITDRITNVSTIQRSGTPGPWENQDELYPNTDDFNSTSLGGQDLRGQKVRHFKMPTHHWVKANLSATNAKYGLKVIDILGLQLSNVTIPADIINDVDSYELLFAKRTTSNMSVFGQSALIYAAQNLSAMNSGSQTNFQSTAGNWNSVADISTYRDINNPSEGPLHIKTDRIRMHPFELLFNKLQLPTDSAYIQFEWKLRMNNVNGHTISFGVDTGIKASDRKATDIQPVAYHMDYPGNNDSVATITSDTDFIRKLKKVQYIPNNINTGEWNNIEVESSVVGQLASAGPTLNISQQHVAVGDHTLQSLNLADYVQFEECFLATLRVLRTNVYESFMSQSLVSTGVKFSPSSASTPTIFAGDVFPCDYCVNNYGWVSQGDGETGKGDQTRAGVKVIRRFVCESIANINQRYEIPGNIYSRWYPHNAVGYYSAYIMEFVRSQDPNQFGYSKDLNSLNDLESIAIFNPFTETITSFPYRIHRGGQYKRAGYLNSWRTLLPLDYYDMRRDRGPIINVQGYDDNLLVHLQSALMVTQDKTTLKGDILSVTLGAGDIFQYAPLETLATKLGYAGTSHQLSCVVTPMGYMFFDNLTYEVFVFDKKLKLLNLGLNTFFADYIQLKENNPFNGNGATIGYDPLYNRVLFTVKNKSLPELSLSNVVPGYVLTPEFFSSLTAGQSITYGNGTWMKFQGINTSPYSCPADPADPTIADATFAIPETTPSGSVVGQLVGSDPSNYPISYVITSGNTGSAFKVDATGRLIVVGALKYSTLNNYSLTVMVINSQGAYDTATITVNITAVNQPPVMADQVVYINEFTANGTTVAIMVGVDPNGDTLGYSLIAGNGVGAFTLNAGSGVITVADSTKLDYFANQQFSLQIGVSDGLNPVVVATLLININLVNQAPVPTSLSASIDTLTAIGSVVLQGSPATDREADRGLQTLSYTLTSQTDALTFKLNLDDPTSADFLAVTLLKTPIVGTYNFGLTVTDSGNPSLSANFTYTITVTAPGELVVTVTESSGFGLYVDANAQAVISGGVAPINVYDSRTVSTTLKAGSTINLQGYTLNPAEGPTPQLHVIVKKNGAQVVNSTVAAVPGASVPFSDTVGSGDKYELIVVSTSTPLTVYKNTLQQQSFTKNDCASGTGTAVNYVVDAGIYTSTVDQATANNMALAEIAAKGQTNANTMGSCIPPTLYYNTLQQQVFYKQCTDPNYTGSPVNYVLAAGKYSSTIDVTTANNMALAEISAVGQNNANTLGRCIAPAVFASTVAEETVPYYADGNFQIATGPGYGVETLRQVINGYVYTELPDGTPFRLSAFAEYPTSGSNPMIRMVIELNGVLVWDLNNHSDDGSNNQYYGVAHEGDKYKITVTTTADAPVVSVPCGTATSYSGGPAFPTDNIISLGSGTGVVTLNFDGLNIPDKFQVFFEGGKVIDTGYRGDSSYQSALNSNLASRGLPPETIAGAGPGTATFNKTTSTLYATVRVWAPLSGTAWNFTLSCPV